MRLLIISLITFGLSGLARGEPAKTFDLLSDIDLGFLVSQPRIPWGGDPFHRAAGFAVVPPSSDKFNLSGIFFSKTSPMAVINGKTVQEGDLVEDRTVKTIGENYVILKKKDSEIEVALPPLIDEIADQERPERAGEEEE